MLEILWRGNSTFVSCSTEEKVWFFGLTLLIGLKAVWKVLILSDVYSPMYLEGALSLENYVNLLDGFIDYSSSGLNSVLLVSWILTDWALDSPIFSSRTSMN